eukprot:SAG11_NODE_655_length_7909_cov_7.307298_2_plen_139_part_00
MKRCETPLAPHRNEENEVPSLPPALSLGELVARTCFLVFLWWTPSIGLTFYNKWLFHARRFPLPLTATLISFGLNSVIAGVLRCDACSPPSATWRWTELSLPSFLQGYSCTMDWGAAGTCELERLYRTRGAHSSRGLG